MSRWLTLVVVLVGCTFPDVTYSRADGSVVDAELDAPVFDGGLDPDASACDRDHDGFQSTACGGADCDDFDPRAHPGADFLQDLPTTTTKGDWNCNNVVEKRDIVANCASVSSSCSSVQGFANDEGCGATGAFVQCQGVGVCISAAAGSRTQACR